MELEVPLSKQCAGEPGLVVVVVVVVMGESHLAWRKGREFDEAMRESGGHARSAMISSTGQSKIC